MSRVLKTGSNQITQNYSPTHGGVDLVKYRSCTDYIIAHSDGEVVEVRKDYNRTDRTGNSYGNYVKIKHKNSYYTLYAHLQYGSVTVSVGDKVSKGQVIAYMGNTGYSFGAHLHFEVRNPNNERINPTQYLDSDLPNVSNKTISYRIYSNDANRWFSVTNDGKTAGNERDTVGGIQVKVENGCGRIKYRTHLKNGYWLSEVYKWDDTNDGYAGIRGRDIDGFAIHSDDGPLIYRVKVKKYGWLPWVTGYDIYEPVNGYAGLINYEIVAVQIKFM